MSIKATSEKQTTEEKHGLQFYRTMFVYFPLFIWFWPHTHYYIMSTPSLYYIKVLFRFPVATVQVHFFLPVKLAYISTDIVTVLLYTIIKTVALSLSPLHCIVNPCVLKSESLYKWDTGINRVLIERRTDRELTVLIYALYLVLRNSTGPINTPINTRTVQYYYNNTCTVCNIPVALIFNSSYPPQPRSALGVELR